MVIQIAGAARGTGTNTADGVQVAPAVNLGNPVNLIYNSTTPQRDIVAIESCNNCHSALAFHGSGARVDTDFCVVCHTNQRKYNAPAAVLGTYTKVYDDGSTEVVPSWNMEPQKFPDGNAMRDFPIMIHSIHAGEKLPVRTAASYIDEVAFPQPLGNCDACHTLPGPMPRRRATTGRTIRAASPAAPATTTSTSRPALNHPGVGGAQADDSKCKTCHNATAIATVYHTSVDPTGSVDRGGYPVNTANNVPTPEVVSGFGRRSRSLRRRTRWPACPRLPSRSAPSPSQPTRRRSSTASCSTVRRSRSCRPATRSCSPASTARRRCTRPTA